MFYFIVGGSKAGKSRYAEALSAGVARARLLYVATMVPVGEGEEGAACISRHRAQREKYGFETIERPLAVSALPFQKGDTVLLEDVANLVANNLFAAGAPGLAQPAVEDVLELAQKCENLVAVSFYGLQAKPEYDDETNDYIEQLQRVNDWLIERADVAVMLRDGRPGAIKGELPRFQA